MISVIKNTRVPVTCITQMFLSPNTGFETYYLLLSFFEFKTKFGDGGSKPPTSFFFYYYYYYF